MEVLESITSYVEDMEGNGYLCENQKEALELLYKYCNHIEPKMNLYEIDSDFFDKFLMYWLPNNQSRLKEKEADQVLEGIGGYCTYIQSAYDIPKLDQYKIMKKYKREYVRMYQLKNLFLKHLGDPIISIKPFVIDFKAYKDYKIRKGVKENRGVYQQGLFEVIEIDYDNTIIIRKLPQGGYVRVMLSDILVVYIKKGDILHLRIKQKQYFSCWEVIDFKNCYLPNAEQYLRK